MLLSGQPTVWCEYILGYLASHHKWVVLKSQIHEQGPWKIKIIKAQLLRELKRDSMKRHGCLDGAWHIVNAYEMLLRFIIILYRFNSFTEL